ncbi:MAG: ABC-type uncharacterized transport system permease component-like protein [Herbinix sp.]|jgi:ABC-2 type transport system permease protein|nr:ABC-type uncharacterized transport system permease component-like protein [Herbinix sp.]
MKKYIFIYKVTLMDSLQYVMNILLGFITFFVALFVFMNLWEYIYSDTQNLISGYSITQMVWYVIITEILWFGTRSNTLTSQITQDIKSGSIAYSINKPYHYILFMIAKNLGEITIKFILFIGMGLIIGFAFLGSLPHLNPIYLPLVLLSCFMGIMINSFLRMGISVLSFWIEDSHPFHWIYDKLILVLGTLFPVEIFPLWAQPIMKCTPIYVVTYGPAKLVTQFSMEMFLQVLLAQGIYFILSFLLLFFMYQKGEKKINVNGG